MEENNLLNKLYINPLETITSNWGKAKGFRLKGELQEKQNVNIALKTLPSLRSPTMGNVIIQNWETKKDIPSDIGDLIHYPVLMDRTKYKMQTTETFSKTLSTMKKTQFSKEKIKKDGELLINTMYNENLKNKTLMNYHQKVPPINTNNEEIVMASVFDDVNAEQNEKEEEMTFDKSKKNYFKTENLIKKSNTITDMTTEDFHFAKTKVIPKKSKSKEKIIDFSTFKKHLYLRDNDFLYAKRVGGPVDYVLCSYQDINKNSKFNTNRIRNFGYGSKKKLPSIGKRRKNIDYITISKNTVLHYQRGNAPFVYSIQEWVLNYEKYKQLMNIPLFKNFKNAKLFDLWRRFYKKTKRQYYTEKLKDKFFLVDQNLLEGIVLSRTILKEMKLNNIFHLELNNGAVLLNRFNDLHRDNLVRIDHKINEYRTKVRNIINESCNRSYQEYKSIKKITLDDNIITGGKQKKILNNNNNKTDNNQDNNNNNNNLNIDLTNNNNAENSNINNNNKKKVGDGSEIQNFIKDAIPYAQDATRKTHYKKLLRYIRVMDYIFNEAKFDTINNSLDILEKRFKRLYTCYINKWVDSPIITTKILCMNGKIFYNPGIRAMSEAIFDNFIQETIYCVVYKKNFIDPQEFPRYMSCFEEVFEVNVDQNSNLNLRLKDQKCITDKFDSLKKHFELCHRALEKTVKDLMPILDSFQKYDKINFKELKNNGSPQYLKDLLNEFHEEENKIKLLKPIINIGIFEFQLEDLLDLVSDAPKRWMERMKKVVPSVYLSKVRKNIHRMNEHLSNLSVNPNDIESFIKLKKAVEKCNKEKQLHEDIGNELIDFQSLLDANKDIKIPEYDLKSVTEMKNINVTYDRKLDSTSYFIDNNISQFRIDLKNEITKFDNYIKNLNDELNNDVLNTYNEDTYSAIDYLEENSLKINKCLSMKEKYQQQENDLELDITMKSNFENLENLVYNQELKLNLWKSIKEFHDKIKEWDDKKVLNINLDEMTKLIQTWLDLCRVAMVDIDLPQVPLEFKKRVDTYNNIIPIIETIQNENVTKVDSLNSILNELLFGEHKVEEYNITLNQIMENDNILNKLEDIKELNIRANEERRLKDLIKNTSESFYQRRIPMSYNKEDFDKEFEFVEENLRMLNRIYLNRYCGCILDKLERIVGDFNKYRNFLTQFLNLQKYLVKLEGILETPEFLKDNPTEHKKLMNENLKKTLFNICKDNRIVQRFFDHGGYEKATTVINSIIVSYEQNYKAIYSFLNKKRKETPRFYFLTDDDLNEVYQEKESMNIKKKMLFKIYPWIQKINIGDEQIRLFTIDNEVIELKLVKSHSLKDLIELLDTFLIKKLKENFKSFKKEYENALKSKINKNIRNVVNILIDNNEYLAQGAFNSMFYYIMDSLEKALINQDEAFDKLFDVYNEVKEEKIPAFINRIKTDKISSIQKRIIINLISLENYSKNIIENLIREDVTSNNDYNFCKLIIPKIENDTYILHFLSFLLEYGYEYTGFQSNFLILPESEKMYITFANSIHNRNPLHIYGIQETGKKEILDIFAKLCGKRINRINATQNYDVNSFNKILLGNIKYGSWICIDESQHIKYELLEVLAGRIMEIYRNIRGEIEDEEFSEIGDKLQNQNAMKNTSIFIYRDLSYYKPFKLCEIPKVIKNYYRQVALPKMNIKLYLEETFLNLNIDNGQETANKILYIIKYASSTLSVFKNFNIQMIFLSKIISNLVNKIVENNDEDLNINLFLKNLIRKRFEQLLSGDELENNRKFLNEVFEIKEYAEDVKPFKQEDEQVEETIKKKLSELKINSPNYENKINLFYTSINHFNNFVLVGPPLAGKSNMLSIINIVSKELNEINKNKYPKFKNLRIYPKSKTPSELFSDNMIYKAYKSYNNYFYDMLCLFSEENEEMMTKLNNYYNSLLEYKLPEIEENLTPEKLNEIFKKGEEKDNNADENSSISYHREEENDKKEEKETKIIIFDGAIDDTWIEYVNNISDKDNFLTLGNGYKLNFRDDTKLFFETANLKNTPPSFMTNQMIVPCSYDYYSWDIMLYTWVESNPKIIENKNLKNYLRGLFENYFPKIYDFIGQNKIKNINLNTNYVMQSLINIFDSIFPMFNFEDVKIGRKNFNVMPKIELIKKCTLSIFIFSCTWTMNLLSNFVIKTKIEKLINDLFKADDLKGPIFDYYIDEETNDFELWSNLLKNESYTSSFGEKNKMFYYNKIFVHNIETIPYTWICEKLIDNDKPFYFNGKDGSGKTFLLTTLMNKKAEEDMEIKKLKINTSYYTTPNEIENYIFKNCLSIKRDLYGDKYLKQICLFVDDLNMNISKDKYGTSYLFEFLRELENDKLIYDIKVNQIKYLRKFNIYGCGNISSTPYDDEFNRFISKFSLITYSTNDDYYLLVFKPSLEFHLRRQIPNTSGVTSTQYIQVLLKLNQLLKNYIKKIPSKLHITFDIKDTINILQSFHLFAYKSTSEYPEYLKKLFFYESYLNYENKLNKKEDKEIFQKTICDAYSSIFKQDKTQPEDIFNDIWKKNESFAFCKDYNNFNHDNQELKDEHCYINNKTILIDYIKSKIDFFYRAKDIKDKNYIKFINENIEIIIKLLRIFENNSPKIILLGLEHTPKRPLLHFASYIAGIDFNELDISYKNETPKNKENFLNSEIKPFVNKAVQMDKKCIFYIPSFIKSRYIYDTIHKLMDIAEIPDNFKFFEFNEEFVMSEEEIIEKLEKNISICLDINYGTKEYLNLFTKYTTIVKSSTVLYINNWDIEDMKTYFNISIKEIDNLLDKKLKPNIPDLLIDIYNYAHHLYNNYYIKSGIKLHLDIKNYNNVCEFYISKYKEYKLILQEKKKKYNDGIQIVNKVKELLDKINKEIKDSTPKQEEFKKRLESKKEKKNIKVKEKNICRGNKQLEDKKSKDLNDKKIGKELDLDEKLSPSKEALSKVNTTINKISQNDLTEIRNTWESFNFGKFLVFKVYELFEKPHSDWDSTKRTLELETFRGLANINPKNLKDNLKKRLYDITKEVVGNTDFSLAENKYQKPFKISGILCDFFSAWNKYFYLMEENKDLIDEINDIKNGLNKIEQKKKEIIEEGKIIDDEIIKIEQDIRELETRNDNLNGEKLKLDALNTCFSEYYKLVDEKVNIWTDKKLKIDTILYNFDFYLIVISSYIIYSAPLNKFYRNQLKNFLYSLAKKLELENIKVFSLYSIISEFLDSIGKDNKFCFSVNQYSEFLIDNFTMLYIMNNKIPYIIDSKRMSFGIISKFLELKNEEEKKNIIKTKYNDLNEIGDMFEKIELAMKNGNDLFIDECEENIYDIFENYINDKYGYNAKTQKNCYLIKNKKIDKDEKFKLYLINSKSSSRISKKAFRDCYVINFNCPSDVICGYITDKLCREQDPSTYEKVNQNKKNINISEFKLLELEEKILNYNKQFDLSGNLDKLDFNQELLEKYKIEIKNYEEILSGLEKNKKILASDFSELFRYQNICTDSTQIYKWCSRSFFLNNLYIFPIDYLSDLVKEFYKQKFGLYKELKKTNKKEVNVETTDPKYESMQEEQKSIEEGHEQEGENEEEIIKNIENDVPTYTTDNSIEYVIFIYNRISKIFEPRKKQLLLLILLLNALNNREDNTGIFKQLLYATYRVYIKGELDEEKYNFKSPLENISDKVWNSLKQISERCSFVLSIFLDDIEAHKKEWEEYLNNDEMIISVHFQYTDENLENLFTPLTKFILFSVLKPHLGTSLIDSIIQDILYSEENYQKELCLNNKTEYNIDLKLDKNIILEDLFKENFSIARQPISIFEVENGNLSVEKELKDHYIKKMKSTNVENNNNSKEGNVNEHNINYKEINPTKLELLNNELEIIHTSMKLGGLIVIKNPLLVEESLFKIIEEIQDKNTVINDNFKLILLLKNNHLLPKFFYSSTNIINNDFVMFKQIKEYLINLIKETPIDLYNKFMNYEAHNTIKFHMKKVYIYFLIINAVLVQYSLLHSKIYKIPVDFCKNDFISGLKFIYQYISSIHEEKTKALLDPDNNFGFNFDSLMKIALDTFINARIIYREDEEKIAKMLSQFFDGEQFLRENNYYFNYNEFILPKINEKLYPKVDETLKNLIHEESAVTKHYSKNLNNLIFSIPKDAVIELFKKIPNEKYYYLLYGISNDMVKEQTNQITYDFFNIFSKDSTFETLELQDITDIHINKKNNLHEIFNIDCKKISEILEKIKNSMPDQLNTTDANPILFKVNKFNELFNPLDECLQKEIDSFNYYVSNILNEINNVIMILHGDIILDEKYTNMLIELNKHIIPNHWKKSKYLNIDVPVDKWLSILNYIYETINNWIINGVLPVYDLSALYNSKLFIITLPIYFQKKLQENNLVSSDKINIEYKLTKYEKIEEINETILENIKKQNSDKDFILIKGLKLRNFECLHEKDIVYQENFDKKEGEELPIILVTYSINSSDIIKELKVLDEEEISEEEEYDKNLGTRKSQVNIEANISKFESQSQIKEDEEDNDEVGELSEISSMTKKQKYKHSKSVYLKEKAKVSILQKYKHLALKKYCKIHVPFIEKVEDDVYELEEPLGYIELKFKCTPDKQEEYFINNRIKIDIDN